MKRKDADDLHALAALLRTVIILLAVSIPFPTSASETGATWLLNQCSAARNSSGDIACLNYIYGVMSGMVAGRVLAPDPFCLPEKVVDPDQARQIVEAYMHDHPEKLKGSAEEIAVEAFKSAFACKKAN